MASEAVIADRVSVIDKFQTLIHGEAFKAEMCRPFACDCVAHALGRLVELMDSPGRLSAAVLAIRTARLGPRCEMALYRGVCKGLYVAAQQDHRHCEAQILGAAEEACNPSPLKAVGFVPICAVWASGLPGANGRGEWTPEWTETRAAEQAWQLGRLQVYIEGHSPDPWPLPDIGPCVWPYNKGWPNG